MPCDGLAKVPSFQRFFSVSRTSPDSKRCIRSLQIAGRKMYTDKLMVDMPDGAVGHAAQSLETQ